jgi:hypothetical protein
MPLYRACDGVDDEHACPGPDTPAGQPVRAQRANAGRWIIVANRYLCRGCRAEWDVQAAAPPAPSEDTLAEAHDLTDEDPGAWDAAVALSHGRQS